MSEQRGSRFSALDGIILLLLVAAPAQFIPRLIASRESRFGSGDTPVGEVLQVPVISDVGQSRSLVASVATGQCRYVVLATTSCPYCRALATRWTITALNDKVQPTMPDGWSTFWVVGETHTGRETLFESAFPVPTFFSERENALIRAAGVRGVPSHVVLDRDGRVVRSGLGAELLPRAAFNDDCTIDEPSTSGDFTPVGN